MMRLIEGGASIQPNGRRGPWNTRLFATAGMLAQDGSSLTRAKKFASQVMIVSGAQAITCSIDTLAMPPRPVARSATLMPPARSMISLLIEPVSPVSSPFGWRAR